MTFQTSKRGSFFAIVSALAFATAGLALAGEADAQPASTGKAEAGDEKTLELELPPDVARLVEERLQDYERDRPPTPDELKASRASYRAKLEELHKSRAARKRESAENAYIEYRKVWNQPGFQAEMRTYAEHLARLRRIGGLAVAEGRSYGLQLQIYRLIVREHTRHDTVIAQLVALGGAAAPNK